MHRGKHGGGGNRTRVLMGKPVTSTSLVWLLPSHTIQQPNRRYRTLAPYGFLSCKGRAAEVSPGVVADPAALRTSRCGSVAALFRQQKQNLLDCCQQLIVFASFWS